MEKLKKGILVDCDRMSVEHIWLENSYDFIIRAIDTDYLDTPVDLENGDTMYKNGSKLLIISDDLKTNIDYVREKIGFELLAGDDPTSLDYKSRILPIEL